MHVTCPSFQNRPLFSRLYFHALFHVYHVFNRVDPRVCYKKIGSTNLLPPLMFNKTLVPARSHSHASAGDHRELYEGLADGRPSLVGKQKPAPSAAPDFRGHVATLHNKTGKEQPLLYHIPSTYDLYSTRHGRCQSNRQNPSQHKILWLTF